MIKRWFEITTSGPAETAEHATALLIDMGSPGVLEDEQEGKKVLKAYIPADLPSRSNKNSLKERLKNYGWTCKVNPFENLDWLTKWKEHIKPIRISNRILIKPTWRTVTKRPGRVLVEIDPGMAFGTGSHASTIMCLWVADKFTDIIKGKNVLDVGTGSGILAITATKLGAKKAVAIDIDPEALKVARKNIKLNKVDKRVIVSAMPLDKIKGQFFIIFANIIAEELIKIAGQLKDRLMDNGFLILSGILQERSHEIETAYKGLGFTLFKAYTKGEWVCLIFH